MSRAIRRIVRKRREPLLWASRLLNYQAETKMPKSMFICDDGRVAGTWIMGNNYRVKSSYYGGYPAGYLKRVRALFPDKRKVLHLFSGKVDTDAFPGDTVDINPALDPTHVDNAETLDKTPVGEYDLVLADPPYSEEDCNHYGCCMVNRNKVIKALSSKLRKGAHIVWLDQVLPMYKKTELAIEAVIGMVKSTNHRFRVVVIFKKL
jgi:hypothetical protein